MTQFVFSDGGRRDAGFKSAKAGDCVARAVAIASGRPYAEVYERLSEGNRTQRGGRGKSGAKTASHGIYTQRQWFKDYMRELGFRWTATMGIGTGCRVHLRDDELPVGRLVVMLSKHATAVIDGVVFDTYDPARAGARCVYGYWRKA